MNSDVEPWKVADIFDGEDFGFVASETSCESLAIHNCPSSKGLLSTRRCIQLQGHVGLSCRAGADRTHRDKEPKTDDIHHIGSRFL